MSTCKYCGRKLVWEKTAAGRPIPCEPGGVYYVPDEAGELYVMNASGEMERGRPRTGGETPVRVGMIPHFQRCKGKI